MEDLTTASLHYGVTRTLQIPDQSSTKMKRSSDRVICRVIVINGSGLHKFRKINLRSDWEKIDLDWEKIRQFSIGNDADIRGQLYKQESPCMGVFI